MDERHGARACRRCRSCPLASASSTGSTKHARELAERTAGVHERGRVGLEAALRHEEVELLGRRLHPALARAVPRIRLGDDGRHAPEEILGLSVGLPVSSFTR